MKVSRICIQQVVPVLKCSSNNDSTSNVDWLSKIGSDFPGRISLCHGLIIVLEDEQLFKVQENGTKAITLILGEVCDFARR